MAIVLALGLVILLILGLYLTVRRGKVKEEEVGVSPSPSPTATGVPWEEDEFSRLRESMVRSQIEARGVRDPQVLETMKRVPRHEFVPSEYQDYSYADQPLPIGYGQTISQPYMVARMTDLLEIEEGDKVLEVGTGSGYQAAILAEITDQVYSVEIIPELAESAAKRLKRLGYDQVQTANLDGYYGWEEHAPYDGIIVTCAPDHIPPSLLEQLKDGGRLVIPVGPPGAYQTLWLVKREGDEFLYKNVMEWIRFVPLTGER
ncbi:MAG: protein-L-isoaspartate(D-aspartate) O-methyltransferase [Anaerolineae bacterium]